MTTATLISERLRTDRLNSGRRRLVRDLEIDLGVALDDVKPEHETWLKKIGGTHVVVVPKNFVTDYSSIPAAFRWAYRFDRVDLAGCCHDLVYRIGVDRNVADRIWEIVATSGKRRVGKVRGFFGWMGLRAGGAFAYKPTNDPHKLPAAFESDEEELAEIIAEEAADGP